MAYRITSANGTSTANQDIIPVMRASTTLNGTDDSINPFRPKKLHFEATTNTTIKVNGENATFLTVDINGAFVIDFEKYDVVIKSLVVVDAGIVWKATFLF
jgi:hypothetical protein